MNNIHSCSYSCERPECIRAQRDELAARLEAQMDQASGSAEYLAYLEAAVDEAGFVIKHDGGTLGNSNFRLEPKTHLAAAQEAVAYREWHQERGDEPMESRLWELAPGQKVPEGAEPLYAAPVAAAPGINLSELCELAEAIVSSLNESPFGNASTAISMRRAKQIVALIDASSGEAK